MSSVKLLRFARSQHLNGDSLRVAEPYSGVHGAAEPTWAAVVALLEALGVHLHLTVAEVASEACRAAPFE